MRLLFRSKNKASKREDKKEIVSSHSILIYDFPDLPNEATHL
jgi:hypothetical protein